MQTLLSLYSWFGIYKTCTLLASNPLMDAIPGTRVNKTKEGKYYVLRPDKRFYTSYTGPICKKDGKYYVPFPPSTPENPPPLK